TAGRLQAPLGAGDRNQHRPGTRTSRAGDIPGSLPSPVRGGPSRAGGGAGLASTRPGSRRADRMRTREGAWMSANGPVVVGLDNGGTANNATVLDATGRFLVDRMVEVPSRVKEGPAVAVEALVEAMDKVLDETAVNPDRVRGVGLDTPGPSSADGVISSKGSTNFNGPHWHGFDFRGALEQRLGIPVVYNNDGNAAALYAHFARYGVDAPFHSSVSAIVGTGLGGGVVEAGVVLKGASGMAGELGHVFIPMEGLLAPGQPTPVCNCGFSADVESVASLTGIERNLLPFWLT